MSFAKNEFVDFLLDAGVVGFFPEGRKLKSGRISHWYANCRVLGDTVGSLQRLGRFVLDYTGALGLDPDYFYGVPEGGTKMGIACSMEQAARSGNVGQRVVMGRGTPKEHGDPRDRYFIGALDDSDRIVVLEDVTTTGGSMLKAVAGLQATGITIQAVVALVNRLERRDDGLTVEEKVAALGIRYHALATAEDVLSAYIRRTDPPAGLVARIEADFADYGIKALKLH